MYQSKYLKALAKDPVKVVEEKDVLIERSIQNWYDGNHLNQSTFIVGVFMTGIVGNAILSYLKGQSLAFHVQCGLIFAVVAVGCWFGGKRMELKALSKLFYLLSSKPYETRFKYEGSKIKVIVEANLLSEGDHVIKGKSHHITAYINRQATKASVAKFMIELVEKAEADFK